jgi:hypothetical protein
MSDSLKKLLKSQEALSWLEKHPEFGGPDSYRGGRRAFSKSANPDSALFAEKLATVRDRLPEKHRKSAKWFEQSAPPREISARENLPVTTIYRAYERLKLVVARLYREYQLEQISARTGKVKLDSTPEHCAIATRHLLYRGQVQVVYLVPGETEPIWVDSTGEGFTHEVQELLHALHEHAPEFEALEAE